MHPLDHPIWSALTTRQQALAEGDMLARRYPPVIGPFAAMADTSAESFAALGALMSPSDLARPSRSTGGKGWKSAVACT